MNEPSWRKPTGIFAILALIAVWVWAVVSFSATIGGWPIWGQSIFYLVAGIGWIAPLKPLLRWMETGQLKD